ncbi:hypothetical protein [Paenibacillus soyae]|uniref:Uncharacterized protein n=1 Tax=Paenibacillus soyae TaxID=2969249 RepID=A0A9X2MSV3_9BACL|nr:hypothetical protein [Paenibacillus soyae]MCR2805201.1 hypothetical protein [Paenibacillus soyae]
MSWVELSNYGSSEYCELELITGEKSFSKTKKKAGFTGLYYSDQSTFFAIYPTNNGPYIYYQGKQLPISTKLSICLDKDGKERSFSILDYNIEIKYKESPYIGFDVWSEEIDVDLFLMIVQNYKSDSFYEKFTS